jgi:hypothetical protein
LILAGAGLGLASQFVGYAGELVGVVLGDQPAVGKIDFGIGRLFGQSEHAIRIVARAAEPVGVEGVADQEPHQAARRVPQQQPACDETEEFSVPARHGPSLQAAASRATPRATAYTTPPPAPNGPRVATTLLASDLPGLTLRHRGKVRDVFELPGDKLLIVATDRLSAFDVVLPDPIPARARCCARSAISGSTGPRR